MTEATAQGVNFPTLHAITADRLASALGNLARKEGLSAEERMALYDAKSLLIRQAATIALVRNALGE